MWRNRYLRALDFVPVRVRYHAGDVARIEVPLEQLPRLADPELRERLCRHFRELGFRLITLDLEGFRSGSLNTLIPVEDVQSLRSCPLDRDPGEGPAVPVREGSAEQRRPKRWLTDRLDET